MSGEIKTEKMQLMAKANETINLQGEINLIGNCLKQVVKNICPELAVVAIYDKSDKPSFTLNIEQITDKRTKSAIVSAISDILKSPKINIEEIASKNSKNQTIKISAEISCIKSVLEKNAKSLIKEVTKNSNQTREGGWMDL